MDQRIKILIADSHYLIRQGLRAIFAHRSERYDIVSDTDDYEAIVPLIEGCDPDVVIIGLNIHGASAVNVIQQVLKDYPRQKILVLDTNENKAELIRILQLGAHGYILKQCDQEEILEAITTILAGKNFFCANVLKLNTPHNSCEGFVSDVTGPIHLSEREIEILELIAQGLTNKEIADKVFISAHTVASHRKNLMRKFRAKNNVDLVISAIRDNFIAP